MNTENSQNTFVKKLDNFWYHHKWKTLGIAFFVIVFAICFSQCMASEKPDQTIFLYLDRNISTNQSLKLDEAITQYFDDFNNNGKVEIMIDNVSYNSKTTANYQVGLTTSTKVLGEIGACNCVFFIVDEKEYEYFMQENLGLFENIGLPDKDGYAWNWNGSKLQKQFENSSFPEDMYFCIRRVSDTTSDNNSKVEMYNNAKKALLNLIEDNKLGE